MRWPMLSTRTRLVALLTIGVSVIVPIAHGAGQIVFGATVKEDAEFADIYVMDEDGTNVRRLTDDPARDFAPRWSPDGKHIAFVSGRGGVRNVYLMDADGGNIELLTDDPPGAEAPAWSPDGQQIAFFAQYQKYGVHIMERDGSNVRFVTDTPDVPGNPGNHFQPHHGIDWAPDGETLLFNAHTNNDEANIWAVDVDGGNVRNLTGGGADYCQTWSPDGELILFVHGGADPGLTTMSPDGGRRNLLLDGARRGCPRWSPDGSEIIFTMDGDIHIVGANGQNERRLVELPGDEHRVDWFDPAYARAVDAEARLPATWGRIKMSSN
jgi:TolB protein